MADHSKPTTTSTYSNFVSELDGRLDDLALGLDPATTSPTNVPTGAIRWSSSLGRWQKWDGSAWGELAATYALTQLSTTGNARIGGSSVSANVNLNVNKNLTGGTSVFGVNSEGQIQSDANVAAYMFRASPSVASGATVPTLINYTVSQGTFTGTVDQQFGFAVSSGMIGGTTNNFAFWSGLPADGTKNYAFYSSGSAPSLLSGTIQSTAFIPSGSSVPANGMYRPATNTIGFATDTTGRLTIDASGNVTMLTAGARIRGDFSNATVANRNFFQSSTTNGITALNAVPNGTATASYLQLFNASDTANAAIGSLDVTATAVNLSATRTGTGSFLPIDVYTNNTRRLTLDTSGNLIAQTATGYWKVPTGTTAQRPGSPDTGALRFNTSTTSFEGYNGSSWSAVGDTVTWRNRIINGDMRIDQRNNGASVTPTNGQYCPDRWRAELTQASKYSIQQVSDAPDGFNQSLKVTSLSAYSVTSTDQFNIRQAIEGFNIADLMYGTATAKTTTVSFWVKSSLTGTFGASIANSINSRLYNFSYTISAANTWEYKTAVIPGDTTGSWQNTNSAGLFLRFNLGLGATYGSTTVGSWVGGVDLVGNPSTTSVVGTNGATFYITGVQLEAGSTATPFERVEYGQMLRRCQRYCEVFVGSDQSSSSRAQLYVTSNSDYGYSLPFKVTKRATPGLSGTYTFYLAGVSAAYYYTQDTSSVLMYATGNVNGRAIWWQNTGTAIFSAEL